MKETGLMFKAPLVRAILSGQKTQTRRILKPPPAADQPLQYITTETGLVYARSMERIDSQNLRRIRWESPVGQPGDRIYVRETFNHFERNENFKQGCECFYRADGDCVDLQPWRPAIHMPKHAARIWLEITGVRVERLQQITEADCWKEGIEEVMHDFDNASQYEMAKRLGCCVDDAKPLFAQLWESTGGDWAANPWVWVIDFKTISTTGRPA